MPITDEDIIRDLLHRVTADVHPLESVATAVAARQRRRNRHRRVACLTAAGAVLGTAAGVIAAVPGHSSSEHMSASGPAASGGTRTAIRLTADQRVLYHLSSVAAQQRHNQGRYAVMSTAGDDVKDTSVINSLTGDMWSYQQGRDGSPSGKGFSPHYSPTSAQFAAMPTNVAGLRAALISQWGSEHKPARNPLRARTPAVVPRPVTVTDDDKVFQQASDMLWNPLVRPALRSALYRVLAGVPGVTVNTSARDSTGQPATEISRVDNSGLPGDRSDGVIYVTYENPATAAVLESTVTYPPGSGIVTPHDPAGTSTVVDRTVYLSVTWANAIPADPYTG